MLMAFEILLKVADNGQLMFCGNRISWSIFEIEEVEDETIEPNPRIGSTRVEKDWEFVIAIISFSAPVINLNSR